MKVVANDGVAAAVAAVIGVAAVVGFHALTMNYDVSNKHFKVQSEHFCICLLLLRIQF